MYPILIPDRYITNLNTLPNFTISWNITILYPILIHCRSVFSHCVQSKQYPQAKNLIAGVLIRPRRNNYPRGGPGKKLQKFFSKNSRSAEIESITQLPILIHCRTHSVCAHNRRIVGSQSESSTKKPSDFVSQSEPSITSPESSANQNRVLRHSRALGSGGGPFLALGSTRLAIVYLST